MCSTNAQSHKQRGNEEKNEREKRTTITMLVNFIYEYKILYKRSTQLLIK